MGNLKYPSYDHTVDVISNKLLEDKLDLLETTKPAGESYSVVYRGKLCIFEQGSTEGYTSIIKSTFL